MRVAASTRTDHEQTPWPRLAVAVALGTVCGVFALGERSAVGQPAPRPRQGEAYTFNLRFLGSVDAGRARLAVSPVTSGPGGPLIHIVGEAEATGLAKAITGLHEDYRLILDGNTWLPRHMHLVESGMRSRTVDIEITDRRLDIVAKVPSGEKRWTGNLPSPPVEPIAVLLLLRAARLRDGDKLALVIIDGTAFYQGTIEVVGREDLDSELGIRRAIKLACRGERITENGQKLPRPPRTATVWVSDDAARLPLRISGETELGLAVFSLTSYEPARRPLPMPRTQTGLVELHAVPPPPTSRPAPPAAASATPPPNAAPPSKADPPVAASPPAPPNSAPPAAASAPSPPPGAAPAP
jgi:hypothetical protein